MATVSEENVVVEPQREWSDLPTDVVGNVIGKLFLGGSHPFLCRLQGLACSAALQFSGDRRTALDVELH